MINTMVAITVTLLHSPFVMALRRQHWKLMSQPQGKVLRHFSFVAGNGTLSVPIKVGLFQFMHSRSRNSNGRQISRIRFQIIPEILRLRFSLIQAVRDQMANFFISQSSHAGENVRDYQDKEPLRLSSYPLLSFIRILLHTENKGSALAAIVVKKKHTHMTQMVFALTLLTR